MSLWNVSRYIAELIELKQETEIINILMRYPLEQRRFIIAIKHQKSSLLFCAVENQLHSVVKYLLKDCKADPNSFGFVRGENLTSLAVATLRESEVLVKTLLAYGADTEIVFKSSEITALYYACHMNRFKIVKILLRNGAMVNHQTSTGQTCLMVSIRRFRFVKLLVSAGADVNLADHFGETCLILALKNEIKKVVDFLLGLEATDIRLKTHVGIDALYFSLQYTDNTLTQRMIENSCYTHDEVATTCEMKSCRFQVTGALDRAERFWQEASQLRLQPFRVPMFGMSRPAGKLNGVIHLFNANDIPPLLFLESMFGFSLHTAFIYTLATQNVRRAEDYIRLCRFFIKEVSLFEDRDFFQFLVHSGLLLHFFQEGFVKKSYGLEMFDLFVDFAEETYTRLKRMTVQERRTHGFNVDRLMKTLIECLHNIDLRFPEKISWLFYSMKRIIRLDLRGFSQKSLLHTCAIGWEHLVERFFLECRADVNNSDKLGRTVLHDLVESASVSPNLFRLIIDYGFDFRAVKYDEYCLHCRLEERGLLLNPMKDISLQCLAAKAFCKSEMTSFSEVPRHLMSIVKSHLINYNKISALPSSLVDLLSN